MVARAMMQRVEALEQDANPTFGGYAVLMVQDGQTEQAKAKWESEHGPVGNRHWVIFNFRARA